MAWSDIKSRLKTYMLWTAGLGIGVGGSSILRNNDFSGFQTPSEDFEIVVRNYEKIDDAHTLTVSQLSLPASHAHEEFVYSVTDRSGQVLENDTLTALQMILLENPLYMGEENPYESGAKITVKNMQGEALATKQFDVAPLLENFNPSPDKPVMILIHDTGTAVAMDALKTKVAQAGVFHALNDVAVTAARKNMMQSAQELYGNNLLIIPNADGAMLEAIAKQICLPEKTPVQVMICGHHGTLRNAGELEGNYVMNNGQLSDKDFNHFLEELPVASKNLLVLHDACSVYPEQFTKGTHVTLGTNANLSMSFSNADGSLSSTITDMLPLLRQNPSAFEINSFLQESWKSNAQNISNTLIKWVEKTGVSFFAGTGDKEVLPPTVTAHNQLSGAKSICKS